MPAPSAKQRVLAFPADGDGAAEAGAAMGASPQVQYHVAGAPGSNMVVTPHTPFVPTEAQILRAIETAPPHLRRRLEAAHARGEVGSLTDADGILRLPPPPDTNAGAPARALAHTPNGVYTEERTRINALDIARAPQPLVRSTFDGGVLTINAGNHAATEGTPLQMAVVDPRDIGHNLMQLSLAYSGERRWDCSLALQLQALSYFTRTLDETHPEVGNTMLALGRTYSKLRQYEEAVVMNRATLLFWMRILPPGHPELGNAREYLAHALDVNGETQEAMVVHQACLAFRREHLDPNHPLIGRSMNDVALLYNKLGQHDDALRLNLECLEFKKQTLPADSPEIAISISSLAVRAQLCL
jgi:hypothetical protein